MYNSDTAMLQCNESEEMATEAVKNGMSKDEVTLMVKALEAMKASVNRAKTKDSGDPDMVAIYDRRIAQLNALSMKLTTKELF